MKKFLVSLMLSAFSLTAFANTYSCRGLYNKKLLEIADDHIQVYNIKRTNFRGRFRGYLETFEEIGSPISITQKTDGFRQIIESENLQLIIKEIKGIMTLNNYDFIEEREFFCK